MDSVTGDAPIHSIVKMKKKYHTELLFALLINSKAEVNLQNRKKKTALHVALEVLDIDKFKNKPHIPVHFVCERSMCSLTSCEYKTCQNV